MKRIFKPIVFIVSAVVIILSGAIVHEVYQKKHFEATITQQIPGIVCWGDSLTYGAGGEGITYPGILENLLKEDGLDIPVYNMGVGGESTKQIAARKGAVEIVLDEGVTIPEDLAPVEVRLSLEDHSPLAILRQGNAGVETVSLGSCEGILRIQQEDITGENYQYMFECTEEKYAGKTIGKGTILTTEGKTKYNRCITVIFMGTNGEYTSADDLINQCREIVEMHYNQNKDRYLILGLTIGTKEEYQWMDDAMMEAFGKRYVNLREYLSLVGMEEAGLEKSAADKEYIDKGAIPPSLLSDHVHLNKHGYNLIGKIVYERMRELGYFEYRIRVK